MTKHEKQSPQPHTNRVRKPLADDAVMVKFSDEVMRAMARIEAAVHDSPHFSAETLENLQEYTADRDRKFTVQNALTAVANLTKETMNHVNATQDLMAEKALDCFISELLGVGYTQPITLVSPPKRRG